jgi:hypothetical protein
VEEKSAPLPLLAVLQDRIDDTKTGEAVSDLLVVGVLVGAVGRTNEQSPQRENGK